MVPLLPAPLHMLARYCLPPCTCLPATTCPSAHACPLLPATLHMPVCYYLPLCTCQPTIACHPAHACLLLPATLHMPARYCLPHFCIYAAPAPAPHNQVTTATANLLLPLPPTIRSPLLLPTCYCPCPPQSGRHCYCLPATAPAPHNQVTMGSDVYSFGVLMWYLYMGMQPYMLKDGVLMRNTIFPHFPRSAQPEYRSLAESCLQRDPHMRPSFVEISSSLSKYCNEADSVPDSVPDHPPTGTPPQPSPPTLNMVEAFPADAPATAPAPATVAAAALVQAIATSAASPTATVPATNADSSCRDEMLSGTAPCVFSHCSSRHALASCWDVNAANSQLLRSRVQDQSDGAAATPADVSATATATAAHSDASATAQNQTVGHHQPTQPALSPPGTNTCLIDSGVPCA